MIVTRKAHVKNITLALDRMCQEWFPEEFSLNRIKEFVVIRTSLSDSKTLREKVGEYDISYTPLMVIKMEDVYGGYERDYSLILNKETREQVRKESAFIFASTIYLLMHDLIALNSNEWLIYDSFTENGYNNLCDMIKTYFNKHYNQTF